MRVKEYKSITHSSSSGGPSLDERLNKAHGEGWLVVTCTTIHPIPGSDTEKVLIILAKE